TWPRRSSSGPCRSPTSTPRSTPPWGSTPPRSCAPPTAARSRSPTRDGPSPSSSAEVGRDRRHPKGTLAMRRIARAVALLVGWSVAIPAFGAEPLVVDLWPRKVPGDVGIKGQETSRIHQSPIVGPTKLITNVTRPTLTIYRPAEDKNTGTAMV